MSVRRGPSAEERSTGYDDFEIQQVRVEMNGDTQTLSSSQSLDALQVEPLGGLARGEAAELVALNEFHFAYPEDAGGSTEHAEFEWEISLDSQAHGIPKDDYGDRIQDNEDHPVSGHDIVTYDYVDPDVLRFVTYGIGTHHGGLHVFENNELEYRNRFGMGPVYDRHDEFHYHLAFSKDGGVGITSGIVHQFIWDVFET